jgi:hypothetical protein
MPGALIGSFGRYELGTEAVTIGRSSSNKLVITDSQVSGRHLQIVPQGPGYLLLDVGSSNGTSVNGQRLLPQTYRPLHNGDVIVIGTTRLSVEIAEGVFPATSQPAPQGEIIFGPPQVVAPPDLVNDAAFPAYAQPFSPAPNYGVSPPQGPVFSSAAPESNAFGQYPGNAPGAGPAYYPGLSSPNAAPPAYQGAPGAWAGGSPGRTGRGHKRTIFLISGILAILVILGGTGLTVYLLSHRTPPGPSIPDATKLAVMPFYDSLEKQDYTSAAKLFTTAYLQEHGGAQRIGTVLFQPLDAIRGPITAYRVVSIKPIAGSDTNETATIDVTRNPAKGTFKPDTLQLVYQKDKWQISDWIPGPGQSQVDCGGCLRYL